MTVAFLVLQVNANTEKTGKQLPEVVKSAIKQANKVAFTWEKDGVEVQDQATLQLEQVVLIEDMPQFCASRSISEKQCKTFALAFVIENKYPIYINADVKHTPSNFSQVEALYYGGQSNIALFLSGLLVHEDQHARGETREFVAYSREQAFMKCVQGKGMLNNTTWLAGYLDDIKSNLVAYKDQVGQINVLVSEKQK